MLASAETPLEEEKVALQAAYGRVLAHDLKALRTQPPFPNSAMDGYAIRSADTASAPATLKVVGKSAAGRAFEGAVGPGEAVRIFTGAPMPDGADTIVIQEDVSREGDRIRLSAAAPAGDNLRPAGMDFHAGDILIPAGRRLGPRDVALAAAANHTGLTVRRRARVAILATGDELVAPGGELGPAQIVASNNFAVAGLVDAYGGVAIDLGIAIDELNATKAAIARAHDAKADVLVTLGGASVGDYDLVQQALVSSGMELGFWRIAMRPGKPLMHGRLGPCASWACPAIRPRRWFARSCSCARCCALCTASRSRAPIPASPAASRSTCPRTGCARTICARRSAATPTEFLSPPRRRRRIPRW